MANRYPYDRDRYGPFERGADEVRSWFGDEEAAYRRRMDERERDRWESDARHGWNPPARHPDERNYSFDRSHPERSSGWRGEGRDYGWPNQPSSQYFGGMGHGHYAEPGHIGYTEYNRETYGGPYGRERSGAREWSSVEGWRVPGPHAGRGPRGYQRTDERIREEINERLTAHGLIDATEIECGVVNGEVTLTGVVDSRAAKRAAEDLAEDIYGVREVHNQLHVRSHSGGGGVGRTSVLGLTEAQLQSTHPSAAPAADHGRPRTRT
jgi:hypothetical protein